MALSNKVPAWKKNQQKETKPKNREDRKNEQVPTELVKIRMNTDYRDVAKRGDIYETDAEKAEELVRLGRAEYLPVEKKTAKKDAVGSAGEGSEPQDGQESTHTEVKGDDDGNDQDTGEATE